MSTPTSNLSPTTEPTDPADPIEPAVDITQPTPPPPLSDTHETFKCQKCGATFADEGSAAAHIQTCNAPEDTAPEDEDQQNQRLSLELEKFHPALHNQNIPQTTAAVM